MSLGIVIFAAGKGTRMRSDRAKVLHSLAGMPLLAHVLNAARELSPDRLGIVYGFQGDAVRSRIGDSPDLVWIEQSEQKGTGHAMQLALPAFADMDQLLVMYGDIPLIRPQTLRQLVNQGAQHQLAVLTTVLETPQGYGRIVRDESGRLTAIVEDRDATSAQRAITEVNTGFICAQYDCLAESLKVLSPANAQGEYYLTDIVGWSVAHGRSVSTLTTADATEIQGVNDQRQLSRLERAFQIRQADALMEAGVQFADPRRFDLRGHLLVGRDVFIDINVVMEGDCELGDGVVIGPHCWIKDSKLSSGVRVREMTSIESAAIGENAILGPFARIRPETRIGNKAHVGNFVEIKKSQIGDGSKINHLSYIGDTEMGQRVNIGAGTITCNYDGANKHRTLIGDDAFIGSDTQLIAPVAVGAGATIGAGSTITRDAPEKALTLSKRGQQTTYPEWRRPSKRVKKDS